jgi:hypothetical protein
MTELAALNVRITGDATGLTTAVNQAEKGLQSVGGAANTAQSRTAGLTSAFGRLSNVSGQTRARIQNTSFQLQDIAVQLQAGTRASTVFAQQLPQLLGGFGAMGAAVGALAGIGIPALAFAFAAAGTEAKTLDDRISELKDMQDALDGSTEILSMSIEELAEKYGSAASQVRVFAQAQAQSAIATSRNALKEQILALDDVIDRYADATLGFNEFGDEIVTSDPFRNLQKDLGLVGRELFEVFDAFTSLKAAMSFEEQQAALMQLDTALLDAGVAAGELPPELNRALYEMRELVFQANELEASVSRAQGAVSNMTFGVPLSGLSDGELLPRKRTPEGQTKGREASAKRLQSEVDALINVLMTQEEAQIASFQRQQETLQTALDQRLITQQEYNDLMQQSERSHLAAIDQLHRASANRTVGQYDTMFGNMATIFAAGGDKLVGITKAFSIAQGLLNSYRAFTEVLADPSLIGRPFLRTALAASTLGAGLAQVSNMRSVGGGGGGGGAASAGAAPSAASSAPAVSRNVAISLTGGDMFSRSQVIQLINAINESVEDGAVVRLV